LDREKWAIEGLEINTMIKAQRIWGAEMATSLGLFYESFLAGLALVLSTRGLMFILITIVLCVIGVFLRSRGPSHLALILILLISVLNLHVFAIFPYDDAARTLLSMSGQSRVLMDQVVIIFAKILYNFGLVLVPLIIYLVSLSLVGQPSPDDD
jgi:hypothetical protein